ncbi:MAG: hypothetical protein IKU26_00820 [Clostridia bacterium]|nr:hypothetical protein [Clostridia bacterium]
MAFNNVPVNGWPQIKDLDQVSGMLAELNELAEKIDAMPTYTSEDRAWLTEWEEKLPELPEDPETDGVKVLTATTSEGETVKSWEEPASGGLEVKTKSFTPQSTYIGSYTTYSDSDLKDVAIVGYEIAGVDAYNFAVTTLISDSTGMRLVLHNFSQAAFTPSAVTVKYVETA